MYQIPMIKVSPILNDSGRRVGMQYIDDVLIVSDSEDPVYGFVNAVRAHIETYGSIILYRQDVKSYSDKFSSRSNKCKNIFNMIKSDLRSDYVVFKLRHNPRTFEWNGFRTAFIVHKMDF